MTTADSSLAVLLIEDNPGDRTLIEHHVDRMDSAMLPAAVSLTGVGTLAEGLDRLADGEYDLVLLDLRLPESTGVETVRRTLEASGELPVVALTGMDDESVAVEAIQAGAQDYLRKGELDEVSLARTMRYAVERKRRESAERRRLAAERERIEQVNRLLRHNLLNGLNLIEGWTERLADGLDDAHPELATVRTEARILAAQVEDVGTLLRADLEGVETEPVDLVPAVERQLAELSAEIGPIDVTVAAPEQVRVAADEHLDRVVQHLVLYAVDQAESAEPAIDLTITVADGRAELEVVEQGNDDLELAAPPRDHPHLGLQLVDTLVSQYGGELRVAEPGGRSAGVWLTLPLAD